MTMQITNERLVADNNLPADFRFFHWEWLENGPDFKDWTAMLAKGCCCPLKTKGKNKGRPNWDKKTNERQFVFTKEQMDQWVQDWEEKTGKCSRCEGEGRTVRGTAIEAGGTKVNTYSTCSRCKGSGKQNVNTETAQLSEV